MNTLLFVALVALALFLIVLAIYKFGHKQGKKNTLIHLFQTKQITSEQFMEVKNTDL